MSMSHSCSGIACDFGVGMGASRGVYGARVGPKSYVFAGEKKFEWKRMTGHRVFLALLDALGVTPV